MGEKSVVEVIEQFIASGLRNKSELTKKTYHYVLVKFHGWLVSNGGDLNQLTRVDIQQYIRSLESSKKSASTINKIYSVLMVFSRFIKQPDIMEDIRIPEVRKIKHIAPKSLERNERNKLFRDVERNGSLRDIAIVYVFLLTGIRVSELCSLNREDVSLSERSGQIVVIGKGNVSRIVPLSAECRLHLNRYMATRKDADPALFLSNFRRRITPRSVQHMLQNYGVHPHKLRHTFCRELVSAGIDIATVAELAGHADINMTRRYSKPTTTELQHAIDKVFS